MTTLADLRKRAGLTQVQVAGRMGVSKVQVSRIEAAYPDVMFPSLRRYMDAIGVDIRFVGEGVIDDISDEVERDATRFMTAKRKQDPSRGFGRKSA